MNDKIKTAVGDENVSRLSISHRPEIQTDRRQTKIPIWTPVEINSHSKEAASQATLNQLFGEVLGEWEESKEEEVTFQAVQFSGERQIDSLKKTQAARAFRKGLELGEICVAIYQGHSGPAYSVSYFHPGKTETSKETGEVILVLFPANFVSKVTQLYQKPMVQQAITDALRLDLETTAKGIRRHQLGTPTDPSKIVQIFSFNGTS